MMFKLIPIAVAMLHMVACMPAVTLEDLEVADDTAAVGSYVREVRAAAVSVCWSLEAVVEVS